MNKPLITPIIQIGKQLLIILTQRGSIDMIPMILGGNVTFSRGVINHRLILSTISKGQFFGLSSRRETEELIS